MEVRCEPATRPPRPSRRVSRRQRLDVARMRIVGLVAMQVDHQAAVGRELAQLDHRAPAVLHGPLEMRDAADDVDAHVERPQQVLARTGRAVEAVLREGHELQRQVGCDLPLDLEQRLDAGQPVVADVDMAADGADALRHRHVAIGQRPLDHRLDGQQRLQLVPELDALEQGARAVQARQAQGQRGVHVEVAVDEGRRDQPARHVELVAGRARRSAGPTAWISPSLIRMSWPCRPSGRLAPRRIRSGCMGRSVLEAGGQCPAARARAIEVVWSRDEPRCSADHRSASAKLQNKDSATNTALRLRIAGETKDIKPRQIRAHDARWIRLLSVLVCLAPTLAGAAPTAEREHAIGVDSYLLLFAGHHVPDPEATHQRAGRLAGARCTAEHIS